MVYTENDKCQQTFSPPLDGKLLQLEGKSSGWSQFPHLEKKILTLKGNSCTQGRGRVPTSFPGTFPWLGGGAVPHERGRGCLSHLWGIKKAVLVAVGVFSFKRSTVGAFGPTFYGIKLCQEKMP